MRSPETKIDKLRGLENFGALVLDDYDYDDEAAALRLLKEFTQGHALILLSSDSPLFKRVAASLSDFPRAEVVERPAAGPG
ncbi:MAG TPA: hypothetical protein VE642_06590, partial [Pyrinomonadaceae bacterium]|nr:hypothetical protein [Pyrinomonadaceae bacterium]